MPTLRAYRGNSVLATRHFDTCVLAKVYFGSRLHTAYYGRRSERQLGSQGAAYRAISFKDIQREIEKRRIRGQGSAWQIYELPAPAFIARDRALLIFDVSDRQLRVLNRTRIKSTLIRDIATQFESSENVWLYDISSRSLVPPILPFRGHTSFADGRSRLLGWKPIEYGDDFTLLQSVLQFVSHTVMWRQDQKPQT
jgi:hypothetical protein